MDNCQRCEKRVYPAEKAGATVRHAVVHEQCFKCAECDQYLTVKTFNTNELDGEDTNVYCATHKPRKEGNEYGSGALRIQDAMLAQNLMKGRKLFFAKHHYLAFVGQLRAKVFEEQQEMERRHRKEEDELMEKFSIDGGMDVKAMAQAETAKMVKKQTHEMMSLLNKLQDDAREIIDMEVDPEDRDTVLAEVQMVPSEVPKFRPPTCRKRDLYQDAAVFKELDDYVCSVAAKEQTTLTELVVDLMRNCESDLKKVRAIFRWITMKDLNVLEFTEGLGKDTPMGLLRGIKYGTESYDTLFMRLCSYAGIPCVDIKGHAKLAGYEPGMKITENTFRSTWNAVLIGGNWWPVHCSWGARVVRTTDDDMHAIQPKNGENLHKYLLNEFYFLTDPDEFIFKLRADDDEKQLLKRPVTLDQFVDMPFTWSPFFLLGLKFDEPTAAVLNTDSRGNVAVKIRLPSAETIRFAHKLSYADSTTQDRTDYDGKKLDQFVSRSIDGGLALFSVHVPEPGSYFLLLYAGSGGATVADGACMFKIVYVEPISEA